MASGNSKPVAGCGSVAGVVGLGRRGAVMGAAVHLKGVHIRYCCPTPVVPQVSPACLGMCAVPLCPWLLSLAPSSCILYSMQMRGTTSSCRLLLAHFPCHCCAMQDGCPPLSPLRTWSIHTRSMPYANRMRHRTGRSCQLVTCLPFGSGLMLRTQHSLAQRRTQRLLVQLLCSMLPLPLASSCCTVSL